MAKFIVLKTTGLFGTTVVREFTDKETALTFAELLRKSEEKDFISYSVAQMIDY